MPDRDPPMGQSHEPFRNVETRLRDLEMRMEALKRRLVALEAASLVILDNG